MWSDNYWALYIFRKCLFNKFFKVYVDFFDRISGIALEKVLRVWGTVNLRDFLPKWVDLIDGIWNIEVEAPLVL